MGVQAVGLVHAPGAPTALSGPARVDFVDRLADPYQMLSEAAAIVPCTFNAPMPLVAETVRLRVQLLPTFRRARATPVAEFASRFIQCYGYMDPLVGIDTESDHNFPPRKGWAGADRALLDLSTRTCSYHAPIRSSPKSPARGDMSGQGHQAIKWLGQPTSLRSILE